MAGYIITMSSEQGLREAIGRGAYGTLLTAPENGWRQHHEGTFADFATMRPGDDIYFFLKRRVYGIGCLRAIDGAVAHANTANAHVPEPYDESDDLLLPSPDPGREIRFFCTFRPEPAFFAEGVDMDDLLESAPSAFRMLRVLWKRSFVKVDDLENQALRDVILRRAHAGRRSISEAPAFDSHYEQSHRDLATRLSGDHRLSAPELMAACADGEALRHEMALEAGLVHQISAAGPGTVEAMGHWDYVSHQVPASPFKPVDYMDFIDVFGYRFIEGHRPTIAKFLVAELKRDTAGAPDVHQLMKYVDWVRGEYAAGDYGLISAFLVARDFDDDATAAADRDGERRYTLGRRPPQPRRWADVTLLRYRFTQAGILELLRC